MSLVQFLGGARLVTCCAHAQYKNAINQLQGHLSSTASAHLETVGPGQFGERCWQESHQSKTY